MTSDTRTLALDVEVLADAMQNIQDRTYLDVENHRYHCGGSEARILAAEYSRLLAERVAPESESELREAFGK